MSDLGHGGERSLRVQSSAPACINDATVRPEQFTMSSFDPETPESSAAGFPEANDASVSSGPPGGFVERRQGDCRRTRSWGSFIRGNVRPRRRLNRRHDDQNLLLVDWYEPRILYLALAIVLFSCTDALFTLNLLAVGAEETNFVMKALLERGTESFVGIKIALTAVSVVVLVVLARRKFLGWFSVLRVMQAVCIGYAGLMVYEIALLWSVMT